MLQRHLHKYVYIMFLATSWMIALLITHKILNTRRIKGLISWTGTSVIFIGPGLYTHRPLPKKPWSPGPMKIKLDQVRYTNQHFILLLFKILWVLSTEKAEHPTCRNVKLTQCVRATACVPHACWSMLGSGPLYSTSG